MILKTELPNQNSKLALAIKLQREKSRNFRVFKVAYIKPNQIQHITIKITSIFCAVI